jgi:proteasome accessory factor B
VADRIREREWHESQELRTLPDGRLELRLRLGALPEIERWVLTWGSEAEVLRPSELRTRLHATASTLLKMYR